MKFGKEYAAQMVPEWQEAYMDYRSLKLLLKDILRSRQHYELPSAVAANPEGKLKRKVSLYRAFSGLTNKYRSSSKGNDPDEVILINNVEENGTQEHYQTTFLRATDEGGEKELLFFRCLDEEFNKVNSFYKNKVEEVMAEADELSKQMTALIAFRIKVEKPVGCYTEDNVKGPDNKPGLSSMHSVSEVELDKEQSSMEEEEADVEEKSFKKKLGEYFKISQPIKKPNPQNLEILDHVKINIAPETPKSTLKGMLKRSKSGASFGKVELRNSEEKLRQAFVEFHRKLRLLKGYSFLNQLALSKIMKKYDKVTSRNVSKPYLEMVDNSCLGRSYEVNKVMERVEATFVKHFANANRRKGMSILRPRKKKERHRVTYLLGFLSGCSVALAVAIGVLIHARDIFSSDSSEERHQYMENIFPLYSLFGYVILHMIMYAANVYFWRRCGVNYTFIFGFKQGTELGYREIFLLSSALTVLTLAGVLSNLDMEMNPETQSFKAITELVPLGLVIIVFLVLFCPFNILYRSSRYCLIKSAFRCLCAPLYKVILLDFFLADQLTSQVQALRSLEFYICYYGWGDFRRRSNNCNGSDIFKTLYVIVAMLPYWCRVLQCLRRLLEEKDVRSAFNGLKYFSTIAAVALRTVYDLNRGRTLLIAASVTSGIATVYGTYWDLVIDWGLLCRNSKNPWLRDKLLISNRSVYFVAMILNILLRLAWMQTVLGIRETPLLHNKALVALVACLEIIRRGIWNFFRLENEHLNNVGNFRAFKTVPLPFSYDDDEDKEE